MRGATGMRLGTGNRGGTAAGRGPAGTRLRTGAVPGTSAGKEAVRKDEKNC